jgi:hypothetical protein
MADPATLGTASQQLINDVFNNTSIWNCARNLVDSSGDMKAAIVSNLASLAKVGFGIAFFMSIVQVFMDIVNNTYGQGVHPLRGMQKIIVKVVFLAVLLSPPMYRFLCVNVIARPCDLISESISVAYSDSFRATFSNTFSVIGDASGKKHSIFTGAFWEQLMTSAVATIVYIVAAAFIFIMPIVQSILFLFALYLGPLCLPFMMCDMTSNIARNWLSFILTIAFWSVIGSLSFTVIDTANLLTQMKDAGALENVLLIVVYGITTLVLLAGSYSISSHLFGGVGGMQALTNPWASTAGAAGAAMSLGAIGSGAGGALLKGGARMAATSGNEKLSKTLSSWSDGMLKNADVLERRGRGTHKQSNASAQDAKSGGYTPNM